MRGLVPFAVVGSNTIIQVRASTFYIQEHKQLDKSKDANGKKVRGRSYPWGSVNIEERQHCDFQALRTLVLAHHMQVEGGEAGPGIGLHLFYLRTSKT